MLSFTKKSILGDNRAIKRLIKFGIGVLFVVFGIFGVFSDVLGATIFETNFEPEENYELGALLGQNGWEEGGSENDFLVVNEDKKSGIQSIKLPYSDATKSIYKIGSAISSGSLGYWFKLKDTVEYGTAFLCFYLMASDFTQLAYVRTFSGDDWLRYMTYKTHLGTYTTFSDELTNDIWYSLDIEWDSTLALIRYNFNSEGWTDWVKNVSTSYLNPSILDFKRTKLVDNWSYFYVDWIAETSEIPVCSLEYCDLCEEWFECQAVGCCWYYQPWYPPPFDNYCDICEGECSYPYNCGLCETETTCETAGCYWTGDYCTQFAYECGPELACQFCATQETCEAEGCNWDTLSETCWYVVPTLPSTWSDYYDLHGGYEVPADFVDELAETTGKTFAIISGLFEGFLTSFNPADALAKGSAMGNVIPKGRGYLKVFDGLFGHLPIGETFVFILIFMLAIGLFRISRQLISLIKP